MKRLLTLFAFFFYAVSASARIYSAIPEPAAARHRWDFGSTCYIKLGRNSIMMRNIIFLLAFLMAVPAFSQVRPDQFFEITNPNNSNFELYSQKAGVPRRAQLVNVKKYMVPFVTDTLAGVPSATGNTTNLGEFVWDQYGALWYIDGEGDAVSFTGGGPIYVTADTTAEIVVYAPSHGLTDTIALYGYVPVQVDFTRANSVDADSVFIAYAIDAPTTDSLTLVFSGVLSYVTWHGKELNVQYYLQDDGSEATTPGTVSMPTAIASDSTTLFLREVGVDIAGRLRRIAMPSALITAFGGNPSSPTDAVVQAAISGVYLPAGLAQPGTVFTLSYLTQSRNPIYQNNAPNTNPITPSYAWLWDGAYATRIVTTITSVDLQDTAYGTLGTLTLLPIDSLMAGAVPADDEVALWLDTNYTINNLRLPNGSLLYFIGDKTSQNPNYIWKVIDDVSDEFADTDWERIVKRVKEPGADGNGILDADNDGGTIGVEYLEMANNFRVYGYDSYDFALDRPRVFSVGNQSPLTPTLKWYRIVGDNSGSNPFISLSVGVGPLVTGERSKIKLEYLQPMLLQSYYGVSVKSISDSIYVDNEKISIVTDTLDATGVTTFLGFPGSDTTVYATLYALADTAAAIRGDIPEPDGNGIIDSLPNGSITIDPNNNDLQIGTPAANNTGEFEFYALTDSGNDVTIYAGSPDSTSAIMPADAVLMSYKSGGETGGFLANNRFLGKTYNAAVFGDSILISKYAADTLALFISQLPITGTSEKYVMVVDSASQLVSMVDADSFGGGGGSDNLGNHTATASLNLDGNEIDSVAVLRTFDTNGDNGTWGIFETLLGGSGNLNFLFSGASGTPALQLQEAGTIEINNAYTLPNSDGTNGQVLTTNGGGTVTWQDSGGGSTVLEVSNDSINIQGGSGVKLGINELVTDSLANDSITFDFESRYQKIFTTDMTSAIDPVTVLLSNPIAGGVYTLDFSDVTGAIDIVWPSNVKNLDRVSLGTYTYSGSFIQTLYYDGTNYIAIPQPEPAIAFENDSVTTTTLTIDLEYKRQKIVEIDMASVSSTVTLTVNNPFYGSNESGVYTFHFMGVSGTDSVIWPAAFVDSNYTALGTDALTTGTIYTCYYNPNSLKYICK